MERRLTWQLPHWLFTELDLTSPRRSDEEKMELAIDIARHNVQHGGGPFGAIVLDTDTGRVVAAGANLVVPQGCSLLHAEIVAIAFAQAELRSYTLAAGNHELVTSSEPCVQCLGAVHWSGLRRLVCGAPLGAAEASGFDEGPRSAAWKEELAARGIAVTDHVLAERAGAVLADYARSGGVLYNAR